MPTRQKTRISAFGFMVLLFTTVAFASPVPETGQTKCYKLGSEIACPSPGQTFYGQDGNYTINPMTYTKLDGSGKDLPNSASNWVMVKDNVTGLIWEMKTNKDGVKNYNDPHDADNTYTWYDSNPATNGGYAGTPGNGANTENFIKALNDAHYGSYSDWRLPTAKELSCIINYSIPHPGLTIDTGYFPNTVLSSYWSSTTRAINTNYALGVGFDGGYNFGYSKSNDYYVRAVRGEQSVAAFTDNGDGTVTDTSTGLMWQQDGSTNKTWDRALAYCEDLHLGGYTDWRLPTIKELRSLTDYSRSNPAINTSYFPNTVSSYYLSSTTCVNYMAGALGILFDYGNDNLVYNKPDSNYVRAVRAGQPVAPIPLSLDIKVNGQDGSITVSANTPVSITTSLAPGDQNGKYVVSERKI